MVGKSMDSTLLILNLSKRQRPTVEPAAVDLLRSRLATFDYVYLGFSLGQKDSDTIQALDCKATSYDYGPGSAGAD